MEADDDPGPGGHGGLVIVFASVRGFPQLISVILPVLNGEAHIGAQLAALARQTHPGDWELVVADNGCTDRTLEVVEAWRARLPAVTVADARARRGLNRARNAGMVAARGDFVAFCDSDDVAAPGWLEALAKAAPGADIVGGRNEWELLNDPAVIAWRPSQPMTELMRDHGFLPYVSGGNLGAWSDVARQIGWDERFVFGSSDHVFAWRAQLAGFSVAFVPEALMHLRFRRSMRAMASQFYRYGRSGPELHKAFRPMGIPPADNRGALEQWRRLAVELPQLWESRERRGNWVRRAAFRSGRVVGSLRARALVL
jgi:glycosyltransferase involved in cell wall biosynthesis